MSAENRNARRGFNILAEIQARYRSDPWSPAGKRFGYIPGLTTIPEALEATLERSSRQGLNFPGALDTDGSDRLIVELRAKTPRVPGSETIRTKP